MRYKCKLAYKGSNYSGFQRQNNANSVQAEIERALFRVYNKKITIHPASRTDKGVHAIGQVFHYDSGILIDTKKLGTVINRQLPADIRIVDIISVNDDFHARYNVKSKEYIYLLNTGAYDLFKQDMIYQYNRSFDVLKCSQLAEKFIGEYDFKAFMAAGSDKENTVRTIYQIDFSVEKDIVKMTIKGDGFLYKMIRIMMGVFFDYNEGKKELREIEQHFKNMERAYFKRTAAPEGLYLNKVFYS